eukprot:snap_masked-scaffold_35-processed-gene-2.37-mRNA-1 protein AED:0.01 eAED:0.01 QI:0/-1/0/1/-1/1/1/0/334
MSTDQQKFGNKSDAEGAWKRNPTQFHNKISLDPEAEFPAEKNRYRLYVNYLCPWAHRTLMLYKLKGLGDCVALTIAQAKMPQIKSFDENNFNESESNEYKGWLFYENEPKGSLKHEPHGFKSTSEIYELSSPGYKQRFKEMGKRPVFSVPILFDEKTNKIVCNESSEIIVMFNSVFNKWAKYPDLNFNPEELREEMKEVDSIVYPGINDGVYRCGFAQSQEAYVDAYKAHWIAMDKIEALLGERKFLTGDHVTLSDIRLFATLFRYDLVYFSRFKTSRTMIKDLPNMFRFLKEMYNYRNIKDTVNRDDVVKGYYSGDIVPQGPLNVDLDKHLAL